MISNILILYLLTLSMNKTTKIERAIEIIADNTQWGSNEEFVENVAKQASVSVEEAQAVVNQYLVEADNANV